MFAQHNLLLLLYQFSLSISKITATITAGTVRSVVESKIGSSGMGLCPRMLSFLTTKSEPFQLYYYRGLKEKERFSLLPQQYSGHIF